MNRKLEQKIDGGRSDKDFVFGAEKLPCPANDTLTLKAQSFFVMSFNDWNHREMTGFI